MKKHNLTQLLTLGLTAMLTASIGCASIMTGGRKEVNFRSEPPGATVTVTDEKGVTVFEGQTPTVVTLKTGKAYFRTKNYTVRFAMPGYQPMETTVKSRVSGWYFGNLIFGGLIGIVIVDPLTGALYTLPPESSIALVPDGQPITGLTTEDSRTLRVMQFSEVPTSLRPNLLQVN